MKDKTLSDEDWNPIDSLFDAFRLLSTHGLLSVELWRKFHCICCRHIWEYLTDSRSRTAVETAERFLDHAASPEDLRQSFSHAVRAVEEAWVTVYSLRIPGDSRSFEWPVSKAVDEAWIRFCAAAAAKTCAEIAKESVLFNTTPESACCIPAWRDALSDVIEQAENAEIDGIRLREAVLRRWEEIRCGEELRLIGRLRELVEGGR